MNKILVVDDEVQIRELLKTALNRSGYDVVTTAHTDHAMSLLTETVFDLIVLDLNIAHESGLQVLKELKGLHSKIPVIIYSGAVTGEVERQARQAGAQDVLRKDLGCKHLVESIERIVKPKPLGRTAAATAQAAKPILIVDDEEGIRHLLRDFLIKLNCETIEADNGTKALEMAQSKDMRAVLLDIRLGEGLSGIEVLRSIKQAKPSLPVMMMTGEKDDALIREAVSLGAAGYMFKPFDFLYLKLVVMSKLAALDAT